MMELENLARFSTSSNPFQVDEMICVDPHCDCHEVILQFIEVSESGDTLENPRSFSARIDLKTWQQRERSPEQSPEITAWIEKFLLQDGPTRQAEYKQRYDEVKLSAKRKAEFVLDPDEVMNGQLLSYVNIVSERSALSSGGNDYSFDFQYQGRDFLLEDRYCVNPRCDCKKTYMEFFELVRRNDGQLDLYQRFLAKLSFNGRPVIEENADPNFTEADSVLAAWWQANGWLSKQLRIRYREVKEIGRRSLDAADVADQFSAELRSLRSDQDVFPDSPWSNRDLPNANDSLTDDLLTEDLLTEDLLEGGPILAGVKVGRNADCPCGSGKKYKKCCLLK